MSPLGKRDTLTLLGHLLEGRCCSGLSLYENSGYDHSFAQASHHLSANRASEPRFDSPESAAGIPLDVVDFIRSRHALATEMENKVYVNIPDRMLAAPTDVQGTIDEYVREFLLLFEFSAHEGIAHYFAEGVLYFWIRPDDLANRRFDGVEFSSTAY